MPSINGEKNKRPLLITKTEPHRINITYLRRAVPDFETFRLDSEDTTLQANSHLSQKYGILPLVTTHHFLDRLNNDYDPSLTVQTAAYYVLHPEVQVLDLSRKQKIAQRTQILTDYINFRRIYNPSNLFMSVLRVHSNTILNSYQDAEKLFEKSTNYEKRHRLDNYVYSGMVESLVTDFLRKVHGGMFDVIISPHWLEALGADILFRANSKEKWFGLDITAIKSEHLLLKKIHKIAHDPRLRGLARNIALVIVPTQWNDTLFGRFLDYNLRNTQDMCTYNERSVIKGAGSPWPRLLWRDPELQRQEFIKDLNINPDQEIKQQVLLACLQEIVIHTMDFLREHSAIVPPIVRRNTDVVFEALLNPPNPQ
ncbi:MAG: hypothetical protein ACOCXT_03985 [Candidatus Dojkabacteria bacterium]